MFLYIGEAQIKKNKKKEVVRSTKRVGLQQHVIKCHYISHFSEMKSLNQY